MLNKQGWATTVLSVVAVLGLILLVGCASTKPAHMEIEGDAEPPSGWVEYCKRVPQDVSCKAEK